MSYDDYKASQPIIVEADDAESFEIVTNIDENDPIWKDNYNLRKQLDELLNITNIIGVFGDPRSLLAQSFANAMQENSKELLAAQTTLRHCFQSVLKVLSYKPTKFDNNQQKQNWDAVIKFKTSICDGIINVTDATAKWFGLLLELHYGLAHFYTTIANGIGEADMAILKFQEAAGNVVKFQQKHSAAFGLIRQQSMQAIKEIESKFFPGNVAVTNAQQKLQKHRQQHSDEVAKLKQIQDEQLDELGPIKKEIIALEGDLAQYELQIKYANEEISNLKKEQKEAAERARKNDRDAELASNYRKEKWTKKNWMGWKKYEYYKDIHTGEKDRLESIADRYRNLRQQHVNDKIANIEIKKVASKQQKATKEKIKEKKKEYEKIVSRCRRRINPQIDAIKYAQKTCEDDTNTIKDAIQRYAVKEHSVAAFLNATHQLSLEPLKAIEATQKITENIEALARIITAQCSTLWTIATYFDQVAKLPKELTIAFNEDGLILMDHLICNNLEEFKNDIWSIVESSAPKFATKAIFKTLMKICTNKNLIREWRRKQEKISESNIANLALQVPSLSIFLPTLHRALTFAWKMSALQEPAGNKQLLLMLPQEIKEFKYRDNKNRKMLEEQINKCKAIDFRKKEKQENKDDKNDKDEEIRKLKELLKEKEIENMRKEIEALKKKKNKKPKYVSSSDDSSEDSEEERRRRKKAKKRKKRKKAEKKKRKMKRKTSDDSSSDGSSSDGSSSDDSSSEDSEEERRRRKKEKKRKKRKKAEKKKRKKKGKNNNLSDSDNDNDKVSTQKEMLTKEVWTLLKLVDVDTAKCIDDDFEKVILSFDENKWTKKLTELLYIGENKNIDVKLTVSSINTGKKIKHKLIDAKLEVDDESD